MTFVNLLFVNGKFVPLIAIVLLLPYLTCLQPGNNQRAFITIDSKLTYQTINGWEITAEAGNSSFEPKDKLAFTKYADPLYDLAVNDLGINRIRLELHSGVENSKDYWYERRFNNMETAAWRCVQAATVNDNQDPFSINWAGFHFSSLDSHVEKVVLPIKQKIEARGEKLHLNLTYVSFSRLICKGNDYNHDDSPEEYAEFILAAFQHLKDKYNLIPDSCEVILEPDNTDVWRGKQIGEAIVATGKRLRQHGFSASFIAPSCTSMANAVAYFDEMVKVPGVLQYLSEISYHRYSGVSEANVQALSQRAERYGLSCAMLEFIGADYDMLHSDLKLGRGSAWQQYVLAWPVTTDNGAKYYPIDVAPDGQYKINLGRRTKFLRQYFRFIRRGAKRIGAETSNPYLDPLAFVNTNGTCVVVIKATAGGTATLRDLPAGNYGLKYTTANSYDVDLPDVTVTAGREVSASIPERGVITVYGKQEPRAPSSR